jgi:D-amino-acid dehydrogenase
MMRGSRPVDDIVVIGAGVVGVTTAHALAQRGAPVCLVDCGDGPAQGASFANGAQLSYAYTDALAAPALLAKLPTLALGLDPVFRLNPSLDPGFYAWLARFLRNMTARRFARNTLAVLELALESNAAMQALLAQHPIAFDHGVPGKMHLHYSPATLAAAAAGVAGKRRHGVTQHILSARDAMAIEPALAQVEGLAGVVYSPDDAIGDAQKFSAGLLDICRRELAVTARFGFDVTALARVGGRWRITAATGETLEAARIVLCAGVQSRAIARQLGLALPIQPMKGYSFTAPTGPDAPRVSITDTARKLVFCALSDRMRVAGLAELGNASTAIVPARAGLLRDLAEQAMPGAADYGDITSEWAGLRPMTPDSRPIVRWVDRGLGLNLGHGMLGWTLAMGSAARLARAMPALVGTIV